MGYDGEFAFTDHEPLIFDLETAPLPDVRQYVDPPDLEHITAPANYKKAEAIADYIAEAKVTKVKEYERDLVEKAALDWNTARIACLGWMVHGGDQEPITVAMDTEEREAEALRYFWKLAASRPLVGFRIREFDLPMLMQRSRYLGVPHPSLDLGRYSRREVVRDLFDILTFNDIRATSLMRRRLKDFARRLGIPVDDQTDGADVPKLIAAGDYEAVAAHCKSDVLLTRDVALRIGVLRAEVAA